MLSVAFVGGLWIGTLTAIRNLPGFGRGPLPLLDEAWSYVADEYYGDLPAPSVRNRGAIRGLLASLEDPYTTLLDPEPAREEQDRLSGRWGSIGVSLSWGVDGTVMMLPFPNGPAETAGVRSGDRLVAIDGERLDPGLSLDVLSAHLEGAVGSSVELTLLRDTEAGELRVLVTRTEVLAPSAEARLISRERGIGYLRIRIFTAATSDEVRQAVAQLLNLGARAIVLDLRGNGGGTLAGLDAIGGIFLPEGSTLYYEVDGNGQREVLTSGRQGFNGCLLVLVDGGTASAAEILAAALRDHGRSLIIGTPTFGKGSVQALHTLSDGSVMHVTLAIWLTPLQLPVDGAGLVPDVEVTQQMGVDTALDTAIMLLEAETFK